MDHSSYTEGSGSRVVLLSEGITLFQSSDGQDWGTGGSRKWSFFSSKPIFLLSVVGNDTGEFTEKVREMGRVQLSPAPPVPLTVLRLKRHFSSQRLFPVTSSFVKYRGDTITWIVRRPRFHQLMNSALERSLCLWPPLLRCSHVCVSFKHSLDLYKCRPITRRRRAFHHPWRNEKKFKIWVTTSGH